jgi:hypothetical protein
MAEYNGMHYGLTKFKTYLSDNDTIKAEVWQFDAGYGIRVSKNQSWVIDECYEGKALYYAEDAAENVVLGIKPIGEPK